MDVLRSCLDCGQPADRPRCPDCQKIHTHRIDQQRGNAAARGYDRRWRNRASTVRREEQACAICGSTDNLQVDHIVAKALGGSDDRHNLRVLCRLHNGQLGGQVRR